MTVRQVVSRANTEVQGQRKYVIDLFFGEGGSARGYEVAGLTPLGVEIDPKRSKLAKSRYLTFTEDWSTGLDKLLDAAGRDQVALVHASPPCQTFSVATPARSRAKYEDLVIPVWERLNELGLPWVIENVPLCAKVHGEKLGDPTILYGDMFAELAVRYNPWDELSTARDGKGRTHRQWVTDTVESGEWAAQGERAKGKYREVPHPMGPDGDIWGVERARAFWHGGFELPPPPPRNSRDPRTRMLSITTSKSMTTTWNQLNRKGWSLDMAQKVMGGTVAGPLYWMDRVGLGESIPPAYTTWIGRHLLAELLQS